MALPVQDREHLQSILKGLGFPEEAVTLFEDNQAAIQIAENPCQRSWIKHLRGQFMFIREVVENEEVVSTAHIMD